VQTVRNYPNEVFGDKEFLANQYVALLFNNAVVYIHSCARADGVVLPE
jgi:hypothetical protein